MHGRSRISIDPRTRTMPGRLAGGEEVVVVVVVSMLPVGRPAVRSVF